MISLSHCLLIVCSLEPYSDELQSKQGTLMEGDGTDDTKSGAENNSSHKHTPHHGSEHDHHAETAQNFDETPATTIRPDGKQHENVTSPAVTAARII